MSNKKQKKQSRLYTLYYSMRSRCTNPNTPNYRLYGGRGINVCDDWLGKNGRENFMNWCIDNGYDENAEYGKCTLDRIDVNGDYSPSNCRFVDNVTQGRNRRTNLYITIDGVTKCVQEWSEQTNISPSGISRRYKSGIKGKELLQDSFRRTCDYNGKIVTLQELSKITHINFNTLSTRYNKGYRDKDLYADLYKKSWKSVVQFDIYGKKIGRYESASQAGRILNICRSGIIECCNNKAKTAGGYVWKYEGGDSNN